MSFTYDTEPTTSYAKDSATSIAAWSDIDILWADPLEGWGIGGTPFTYDAEPTGQFTWAMALNTWQNETRTWRELLTGYDLDSKPTL